MKERIESLLKAGIERILNESELRAEFHKVATQVFGENCLNCDGSIREKFTQLTKLNSSKMETLNYKLREGRLISVQLWNKDFSNKNLTNKDAVALLNLSFSYIKDFVEAPHIEELKALQEQGVKSYKEALALIEKENQPEPTYDEKLVACKGIGKATANKIMKAYPTEELLIDALKSGEEIDFLKPEQIAALKSM